jgi:catechol 2,3-dioxygenase-like lactoylglutathione lyase family enzyme
VNHGSLHHVELWVPDLTRARQQWGWLLGELGYEQFQDWEHGRSWLLGGTYLVVEQSPALTAAGHDRLTPPTWPASMVSKSNSSQIRALAWPDPRRKCSFSG